MKNNTTTKMITQDGIFTALVCVFIAAAYYIPINRMISLPIIYMFVGLLYSKKKFYRIAIIFIVSTIIAFSYVDPINILVYFVPCILIALIISRLGGNNVLNGVITFLVISIINFAQINLMSYFILNKNLVEYIFETIASNEIITKHISTIDINTACIIYFIITFILESLLLTVMSLLIRKIYEKRLQNISIFSDDNQNYKQDDAIKTDMEEEEKND